MLPADPFPDRTRLCRRCRGFGSIHFSAAHHLAPALDSLPPSLEFQQVPRVGLEGRQDSYGTSPPMRVALRCPRTSKLLELGAVRRTLLLPSLSARGLPGSKYKSFASRQQD
jgi:hypothetical protein